METIYLSLREQVAVGTFFMKSPIAEGTFFMKYPVSSVYTLLNNTIYLSHSTQVAWGNRFQETHGLQYCVEGSEMELSPLLILVLVCVVAFFVFYFTCEKRERGINYLNVYVQHPYYSFGKTEVETTYLLQKRPERMGVLKN